MMKRGDIYFANLDPTIGDETKKIRPVLIVSNNANNRVAQTITIVPITSNVTKVYPFEVLLEKESTGLSKTSKAQCHQVRTISKSRIVQTKTVGTATQELMIKIQDALKIHLSL
jgi:mRNA interferase MazF